MLSGLDGHEGPRGPWPHSPSLARSLTLLSRALSHFVLSHRLQGLCYTEEPCIYVTSTGLKAYPVEIVRPTETMLKLMAARCVNPEVEPVWKVVIMDLTEDFRCKVMFMATICETFSQACDGLVKADAFMLSMKMHTFMRMDPKKETLQTVRKMKMFDMFAAEANIKILRYSVDLKSAIGVMMCFE